MNCETNTRQLYGLLTGQGSAPNKNAGRPWSNTATLAPKRVTNKVQPVSLNSLNKSNSQQSQISNNLVTNVTPTNNLINIATSQPAQVNNQSANQRNSNKPPTNQANKTQHTLPTIYESNHYKETDLQPLFNSFASSSKSDKPPLPSDPPPSSSSFTNSSKLNSFSISSSSNYVHHQPSAVLKKLPPSNGEPNKVVDNRIDSKNDSKIDKVSCDKGDSNKCDSNHTTSNKPEVNNPSTNTNEQVDSVPDTTTKQLHLDKYEEEITIYQRPVPLPGRLIKSSSLEDLFKIKVCKLNPLCPRNGRDPFDQSKTIIFCANPGPLAKIKSQKSNIESPNHKLPNENDVSNGEQNQMKDEKPLKDDSSMKDDNHVNNTINTVNTVNIVSNHSGNFDANNAINNANSDSGDDQTQATKNEHQDNEDDNSLNTAIAASFKGFLGDLQACKQNQLALSTFRPLANTTQQHSTGITGTLNTSSIALTQQAIKPDPSVEQIATLANPFSFTKKKPQLGTTSSVPHQTAGQSNQTNLINSQSSNQDEQSAHKIEQPDITDLLKEFDVCFGDEAGESANDLISFSNESNGATNNADHFKFPLPPPSMLSNCTINSCPSSSYPSSYSACLQANASNGTSNGNSSNQTVCSSSNGTNEQSITNLGKPSNCSSTESLQSNESTLSNLLSQTALKQASLGPAALETCGSQIHLTELDLSKFI